MNRTLKSKTLKNDSCSSEGDSAESDDLLMLAYSKGHLKAFDQLYGRYSRSLYAYLSRNCIGTGVAEELYQDVWLRVISSASKYNRKGKFRSWLFTLAHNRLVDYYRSSDNKFVMEELGPEKSSGIRVDKQVEEYQIAGKLDEMVQALPLEQKTAFYLREESGFALKDIAEIQGVSLEAAKSRLRYAYKKLREKLDASDYKRD